MGGLSAFCRLLFSMSKIAIITDSNSGVTQSQAEELGIFVVPMPFMINNLKIHLKDIQK